MFAGEGTPERTNRRFHLLARGPAGGAALDRLRQRDALRPRSRRAPRRLRQGRQLGRLGLHASTTPRSSTRASTCCDAEDLGLDDDQRPGADRAGVLPERGDRPGGRAAPARDGRLEAARGGARARELPAYARARCRAGHDGLGLGAARHPGRPRWSTPRPTRASAPTCCARVRGTVQADILKEDQAQNTCIFSTEFALKLMGDVQEWFVANTRCGTSTRSRSPATTSPRPARTRSRSSPSRSPTASPTASTTGARHGGRRLRAELLVLLQQRARRRVQRDRPRGAAHLGDRAARALRRLGAQPEAQVPRADLGPLAARAGDGLQRHPHHAAGAAPRSRTTATACTPTPTTRR